MRLETSQGFVTHGPSASGTDVRNPSQPAVASPVVVRLLRLAAEADDARVAMACYSQSIHLDQTAHSHVAYGRFLVREGLTNQAIRICSEGRQKALTSGDLTLIARASRGLAEACRQTGQLNLAEGSLQQAASAEMNAWHPGEAEFSFEQLLLTARLAGDRRDWNRSMALSLSALKRATIQEQPLALCQLATALFWTGDLPGAARQGLLAMRVVRQIDEPELTVDVLLELTPLLEAIGRVPMALKAYQLASQLVASQKLKSTAQQARLQAARIRCRERIRMTCIRPEWN